MNNTLKDITLGLAWALVLALTAWGSLSLTLRLLGV